MATHTTLASLFTDIANAIRSKTGDTSAIVADNFPSEISGIETIKRNYLFKSGSLNIGFEKKSGSNTSGTLSNGTSTSATYMRWYVNGGDGYGGVISTNAVDMSGYDYICFEFKGGFAGNAPSTYDYVCFSVSSTKSLQLPRSTSVSQKTGALAILSDYGPSKITIKVPLNGLTSGYPNICTNRYNYAHTYDVYNIWLEK